MASLWRPLYQLHRARMRLYTHVQAQGAPGYLGYPASVTYTKIHAFTQRLPQSQHALTCMSSWWVTFRCVQMASRRSMAAMTGSCSLRRKVP
jgi:hypothetical protein